MSRLSVFDRLDTLLDDMRKHGSEPVCVSLRPSYETDTGSMGIVESSRVGVRELVLPVHIDSRLKPEAVALNVACPFGLHGAQSGTMNEGPE